MSNYQKNYMRSRRKRLTIIRQRKQKASVDQINRRFESSSDDSDGENLFQPAKLHKRIHHSSDTDSGSSHPCGLEDSDSISAQLSRTDNESDFVLDTSDDEPVPSSCSCPTQTDTKSDDNTPLRADTFQEQLQDWVQLCSIRLNHVDKLLSLLRTVLPDLNLPKSARTLLRTKPVVCTKKSGMDYIFLGVKTKLKEHLEAYPKSLFCADMPIEMSLNVDGVPVFNSKNTSMWPLLCCVHLIPATVFTCVLTYGPNKPTDHEFLREAVEELKEVLTTGIEVHGITIHFTLRAVICDAPAKAMIKCVKQFNGNYGCDRCSLKGEHVSGRHIFAQYTNLPLRSDESFRNQDNKEHHNGVSIFCDLHINMVSAFPHDYMHQLCLGVMKKLLKGWTQGIYETRDRKKTRVLKPLQASRVALLSERLVALRPHIPSPFARKPRGLHELAHWKATEFRQFLLYTGVTVLRDVLDKDLYDHFCLLCIASRILICPKLAEKYLPYARQLLIHFVEKMETLYRRSSIVYNIHSLLHLCDDVQNNGSLDNISAFPFENYLQTFKYMVRKKSDVIVQVARRISERRIIPKTIVLLPPDLKCVKPNNAYLIDNDMPVEVIQLTSAVEDEENIYECWASKTRPRQYRLHGQEARNVGMFVVVWKNLKKVLVC